MLVAALAWVAVPFCANAQPPGSAAAEKAIRADYALLSRPSLQAVFAEQNALATPDFQETTANGKVENRAEYLQENRVAGNLLPLPGRVHLELKGPTWQGNLAIFDVVGDTALPFDDQGQRHLGRQHFVSRDTWELVGKVWMTKSIVYSLENDWVDGKPVPE